MNKIFVILFISLILVWVSTLSYSDAANQQKIPELVRNIFIWYGENKISEDEAIGAIKFLIENKIIQIDFTDKAKDGSSGIWLPKPETRWNWQLDTPIDTSFDVDMYDIDLFDNDKNIVKL